MRGAAGQLTALGSFIAGGVLLYWIAIPAHMVADDWAFLALIDDRPSLSVILTPLVERYLRPLVVLLYYVNFKAFGTWPPPYHLTVIVLHGLNAWLLYRLLRALPPGARSGPGLQNAPTETRSANLQNEDPVPSVPVYRPGPAVAGAALFLAFAGHSEAVAWVGGVADVILMACLFGSLVLIAEGIDRDRPTRFLVPAALLLPAGLMAKETGVIAPALAAALCLLLAWQSATPSRVLRRAAMTLLFPVAAVVAYLVLRSTLFGSPIAAYNDLATSTGMMLEQSRAFLLRVFLPAYSKLAIAWANGYDLPLIAAGLAVFLWCIVRDRQRRGVLLFAAAGILVSLAPALPLTISLSTTETERVVYIPTAFGAILTVVLIQAAIGSVALQRALIAILIAAHAIVLQRFNRSWVEAGEAFSSIVATFVETARAHDPGPDGRFFLLNLPDNVRGAYVFRRGFYDALRFAAPDLARRQERITGISSHTLWRAGEPIVAAQTGPRDFTLNVEPNRFLQTAPPVRPFYEFITWSPQRYHLRFSPDVGRAVVFRTSEARVTFMADIGSVTAIAQ